MELNWTTFVLEIINFLVLVWILKRFLYKPVLCAIERRKAAIDQTLADATTQRTEAQSFEEQYRNRLAEWEREKETLRAAVLQENEALRNQLMSRLQDSLKDEREKENVLGARRMEQLRKKTVDESATTGLRFTARLFSRCASPELQATLITIALDDLPHLPNEQIQAIQSAWKEQSRPIKVTTAFSLPELQRTEILKAFDAVMARDGTRGITAEFAEDRGLLAGLRISLGPWLLRANLQDELQFFAEAARHDSASS